MSYKMREIVGDAGYLPNYFSEEFSEFETLASLKEAMKEIVESCFTNWDNTDEMARLDEILGQIDIITNFDDLPTYISLDRFEHDLMGVEFEIEEILPPQNTLPPCGNDMLYLLWYLGNEKPNRIETGFSHKLGYNRVTYWYKFEAGYFGIHYPLWISLEIQNNGMIELKFWESFTKCVWRMALERNGEFFSYAPNYVNPNDI